MHLSPQKRTGKDEGEELTTEALINAYTVLLRLIDVEKINEERSKPLRWLAYVYAALGDTKMFKKWAKETVEYIPTLSGSEGFFDAGIFKGYLEDPTTHPYWGLRSHWRKGVGR